MKRAFSIKIFCLGIGFLLLLVGVVWRLNSTTAGSKPAEVKQQVINMNRSDFDEDPALKNAIDKQLGDQNGPLQSPQTQTPLSPSSPEIGNMLQSTSNSLQAR